MKTPIIVGLAAALTSCGPASAIPADKELMSHDWSPKTELCSQIFVRFTPTSLEFHIPNRTTHLKVWNILAPPKYPRTVMAVVSDPEITTRPADTDLGAFLFELSGDRMKLIAQGSPVKMFPATPENLNTKRFDLSACPKV